jgi:ribosome biogenesis GTPase A
MMQRTRLLRTTFSAVSTGWRAGDKLDVRSFSKRTEWEDQHHLARALSRPRHGPELQQKWEKMMSKKFRPWKVPPFELFSSAPYELDALENIHKLSFECNVLLEIRDVRLPASTHHPSMTRLAKHRLHLICYTHADMIDPETRDRVEAWTDKSWPGSRSIFVDTREHRQDLPYDLLYDSLMGHLESAGGNNVALTCGVANTGKSSLLMCLIRNARQRGLIPKKLRASRHVLRTTKKGGKKKRQLVKVQAPEIQDKPGKTRELTEYMLREKPRMFFLDVPGLTPPKFFFEDRPEAWFGFAAANLIALSKSLQEDPEAQTAICDYVLHCLNRDGNFLYVEKFHLEEPTDNIDDILPKLGQLRNKETDEKLHLRRCRNWLKFLNTGNLGSVVLDDIRKPYVPFVFLDRHFSKRRPGEEDTASLIPERARHDLDDDGWSFAR